MRYPTRPRTLTWLGACMCVVLCAGCGRHPPTAVAPVHELNFYNWADYIDPAVLLQFQQETGITVHQATYASPQIMETTLLAGHSLYDVVVTSDMPLEALHKAGAFKPLDRERLKNLSNLDEAVLKKLAAVDPDNRYAIPYLWGVTGLAVNVTALHKVAPTVPLDSWSLIFDPKWAAQAARCRIGVVDSPEDVIDPVLLYLGKDASSVHAEDLSAAAAQLQSVRPSIAKISSDDQINDLATGETCVLLTWTYQMIQAKRRAHETGNPADLRFVFPREGALIFIDALAIPADAPHPDEALHFLDFLLRPDVAARNATFVAGATPNRAALPLIDAATRDDPAIYPPASVIAALHQAHRRPPEVERSITRDWTRFRTGT